MEISKSCGGPLSKLVLLLVLALFGGCGEPATAPGGEGWLVRVADAERSVADFHRALEVAKMAYPHNALQEPEIFRNVRLRVLGQMAEELLLLKVADEHGIGVTDAELSARAAALKADFPDGEFERTLLESAVSERAWMESLRARLLMERVIDEVLCAAVTITPDEIRTLYREYEGGADLREDGEIRERIVRRLRRRKAEAVYGEWLGELRKRCPVEINGEKWEEIEGS